MARGQKQNDDLLMEDELAAAFLGDDDASQVGDDAATAATEESWEEEQPVGQLAVDVFETKEKLVVKARTAGVNKQDLDNDLARAAGTTVRNVRVYQDRGLLPPPEVRARVGYYNAEHVARLRPILDLQADGFVMVQTRQGYKTLSEPSKDLEAPTGADETQKRPTRRG